MLNVVTASAQSNTQAQVAFSAFQHGQWDIFSVTPDGTNLRQLTNDTYQDMDPAFSPDGTRLAYASRRNDNWDIYTLDLQTGAETRVTVHPDYDGRPAWNPEDQTLAFESFRSGDLDIWLVNPLTGGIPRNLTADSPAGDFQPAWDSRGERLFFVSWRAGDNDIWQYSLKDGEFEQLTTSSAAETDPVWDEAGQSLLYTRNHLGERDIWRLGGDGQSAPETWLGSAFSPALTGDSLVAVMQLADGYRLVRLDTDDAVPVFLTGLTAIRGGISWHPAAVVTGEPLESLAMTFDGLYTETLTPSSSPFGEPYDLIRLNDLQTGTPWLADTVDDSFQAMRAEVRQEVGYDFLGEVSEALRPLDFFSDASQYSSWHKSGRAFDTLFDLPGRRLEIVKEDVGGETYWRIFLRCEDQSGRCGLPLTANAWDYSGKARVELAPEQGGIEKPNLTGYYLDFSSLAELYGWERIASYDDEDFSWTWHFKAFEYWHHQKKLKDNNGVSNWYQAMRQVYPPDEVDRYFTWSQMRAADEDPYLVALKGVSLPPPAQRWWRQLTENTRQ